MRISKESSLDWFHYDDIFVVLSCNFPASSGLDLRVLPISPVKLKLDKFSFRMFCQNIIQDFRSVMKRETKVLDQSLFLLLQEILPEAPLIEFRYAVLIERVQEIEIEVACTGSFKRYIQLSFCILFTITT